MRANEVHRVVIVGGGFAGLRVAKSLGGAAVRVTLLDRRNHHVFQPLLYQVATGMLSPANIATPLRSVLGRQTNVEVLLEDVVDFDVADRRVRCRDRDFRYDTLVLEAGVRHHYFGREWLRSYFTGARSARLIEGSAWEGQLTGAVVPPLSNGAIVAPNSPSLTEILPPSGIATDAKRGPR
jgi:NADH dehydrogenase FAD-containing subunit